MSAIYYRFRDSLSQFLLSLGPEFRRCRLSHRPVFEDAQTTESLNVVFYSPILQAHVARPRSVAAGEDES